ncbi:MAG TPA: hypothetical protein VKV05_09180 [Terriglobales bacterium]|nr:hypothetical protein [Terriglobales bacterium]
MNKLAMKRSKVMVLASATLLLAGCSISVNDKDKKNEKVDIQTPFANLKVDSSDKAADNGIPVYPGAHLRPSDNGDNHSANVDISAAGFGLKVIAAEYETSDSPEKVKAFYEDKMKTFGPVLVCNGHSGSSDVHISKHGDKDKKLDCSDTHGSGWEIKTGTSDDERLVSIEPNGSGTRFGTVLIQTRGKQETL